MESFATSTERDLAVTKADSADSKLSLPLLNLVSTFVEELIREEHLSHQMQVTLRQLIMPISTLMIGNDSDFANTENPARAIFKNVVNIAKLSDESFGPGDTLYQTMMESIKSLKQRPLSDYKTLTCVQLDLEHVCKLARMRAPIGRREDLAKSGAMSDAKITAVILLIRQCSRFDVDTEILYFLLTEWLELFTVTILIRGSESPAIKQLERLTFSLLYMDTNRLEAKQKKAMRSSFPTLLKRHIRSLGKECHGHTLDFSSLFERLEAAKV